MIQLTSIRFAHRPSSDSYATALNVRENASEDAPSPEWMSGSNAASSRAVYALSDISGHLIKIKVRLSSADMQQPPVYIRAVAYIPTDQQRRGCNFFVTLFTFGRPNPDDINVYTLGDVAEQQVNFISGDTGEVEFTVAQRDVDYVASGKTTWTWQYRNSLTDSWTTITQSEHTIYTILSRPTSPWAVTAVDESSRHHLLWTDLLEHACWWARGQRTLDGVAGALTQQLFERGSASLNLLRYEHGSGNPAFADMHTHQFNLQGFLQAIDLSRHSPTAVNCDDCSCALVSLANALGCNLWVVPVGSRPTNPGEEGLDGNIYLNPIRVIGSDWNDVVPDNYDASLGNYFFYHSIAMDGNGTYEDNVYDGMLQVNGSASPSTLASPPIGVYVKKFRFGIVGDTDSLSDMVYRYRLAKQDTAITHSQEYCTPRDDVKYRPILWWA